MARITVEDCLTKENNRFKLVHLAAKRVKQILTGSTPTIQDSKGNKQVVIALREIADGQVRFMTEEEMLESKNTLRSERDSLFSPEPTPVTTTLAEEVQQLLANTDKEDDLSASEKISTNGSAIHKFDDQGESADEEDEEEDLGKEEEQE